MMPFSLFITFHCCQYNVGFLSLTWATFIASIYNMRVDFSDYRASGQVEPETACYSPGGSDLSLRYSDYETVIYD